MPLLARLLAVLAVSAAPAVAGFAHAQAPTVDYDGAVATGLALRRLGTTARVLHIGAHPDDENTALFAPLALGRGADAAYLSLTRGEGGQNGIGPELGVALGIVRSEELLAARRLDGGEQFFARVIDYGYSKSAEEAFRHWPKDSLLADVVEIIRRYRPDVVASVWSGTPRDGHGQHEASGIVAREAVLAAADPGRFPEQIAAGLRPHATTHYYRSAWFGEGPPDVELNTGVLDPLLGHSYHQVAMASRSRHRSQDQGNYEAAGPRRTAFDRVDPTGPVRVAETRRFGRYSAGAPTRETSLFEGADTLLSQRAASAARAVEPVRASGGLPRPRATLERAVERLRDYEGLVQRARASFNPVEPWALLPTLLAARERLDAAAAELDALDGTAAAADPALHDLRFHLDGERGDLRDALVRAANVRVDAVADRERVVPGETFRLELSVWNGGRAPVTARLEPALGDGWSAAPAGEETASAEGEIVVAPGDRAVTEWDVTVPADAPPTTPYYLDPREPLPEDTYRWPADPSLRGEPFASGPVRGAFALSLEGRRPLALEREAAWVGLDRRSGEYRRPVKVVPAVSVTLSPDRAVVPLNGDARALDFTVRLRSEAPAPVRGTLRLDLPAGWTAEPGNHPVELAERGEETGVSFRVRPPAGLAAGEHRVGARFESGDARYDLGYDVIDYPHIAPHHLYRPATATVRGLDVRVADVRVGYVAGSGDGVPGALEQLGVPWQPLERDDLAAGDLGRFDVIITGARAYELRDDLVTHNRRLLDWVRAGGTLIVQYNKYEALDGDYAPWPVTIARPHGRVTDETAPVRVLEPEHPVFTTPNTLGPADWEGWVQERGLYFWDTWDGPLTPLLAMSDPGEEPLTGALLVAPLGEGNYVYTGLAFFRQLPEGVPGAYRLLANLISMGAR